MAEAKKARARTTRSSVKSVIKAPPAAKADTTADWVLDVKPASLPLPLPAEEPIGAAQVRNDVLRQAVSEAVVVSARGALEINDKIIEALQAQSDAAFAVWKSAVSAPRLSDAIRAQTSGTRQAYETASAQWADIATTTAQWLNRSLEPLQSAFHRR
jgi:hypothetical protein